MDSRQSSQSSIVFHASDLSTLEEYSLLFDDTENAFDDLFGENNNDKDSAFSKCLNNLREISSTLMLVEMEILAPGNSVVSD